jgi:hypothetical protein
MHEGELHPGFLVKTGMIFQTFSVLNENIERGVKLKSIHGTSFMGIVIAKIGPRMIYVMFPEEFGWMNAASIEEVACQ